MERNYDELISDMLIQLDKHSAELAAIRKEQNQVNKMIFSKLHASSNVDRRMMKRLDNMEKAHLKSQREHAHSQREYAQSRREYAKSQKEYAQSQKEYAQSQKEYAQSQKEYAQSQKDNEKVHDSLLDKLIHTATILDRIIRKNELGL